MVVELLSGRMRYAPPASADPAVPCRLVIHRKTPNGTVFWHVWGEVGGLRPAYDRRNTSVGFGNRNLHHGRLIAGRQMVWTVVRPTTTSTTAGADIWWCKSSHEKSSNVLEYRPSRAVIDRKLNLMLSTQKAKIVKKLHTEWISDSFVIRRVAYYKVCTDLRPPANPFKYILQPFVDVALVT